MQLGGLVGLAILYVTLAFFCSRAEAWLLPSGRNPKIPWKRRIAGLEINVTDEDEGIDVYVGEPCENTCSNNLHNIYCNLTTKRCECLKEYPVRVKRKGCVKGARLWEKCDYTESCSYYNDHAMCNSHGECRCEEGYKSYSDETGEMCIPGKGDGILENPDLMTGIMVVAGVMIGTALFCLVLRLFSRARFGRNRGRFGNAAELPVVLTGTEALASIPCSRPPSRGSASNEYLPSSRSASVRSHASVRSYAYIRNQSPIHKLRGKHEKVHVRRTASLQQDEHSSLQSLNYHNPNSTAEDPKTESVIPETATKDVLTNNK
ncbi:uncharacterized protein LOC111084978 [Limulus polyphemus]|uniref:Uncharacterized protein LOC111084978 n=1 Tax=Limulus polyphemus TaxID=6850 RepID=A0ABM1S1F1_LIMPO|nr:uncharacterized protein LOC111084978 [Limulus polyphemus]